jgi:EAL domain-containing protein (putative c-di-GMP-specific phosphodiesterase class I)
MTERVLSQFSRPMNVGGKNLTLSASVGISMYPSDGSDADTLMRHAEVAMYEAKNRGRNTWCLFDDRLSSRVVERLAMENALRGAIERDELIVHYQPQIDLDSGRPVGMEALVRWNHPDIGLLPPSQFIGLAEECGVINPIGAWVLGESCHQVMAWRNQGLDIPSISVNLSVRQIEHGALVAQVARVLEESGMDASSLELELTESMIMRDPDQSMRTLAALKNLGVKLSIDDFGTGHSSLAYLKRLPLDRLKIDRAFVRDIGRDPDDEAICRTVIELARQLGLSTIAEGVEREEQAEFMRREGCQVMQGFLYSKPLTADALAAFWTDRQVAPNVASE